MALLHAASLTPTKLEAIVGWLPAQPWAPADLGDVEVVGAYRFDDPAGQVGVETHLVRTGGLDGEVVLQVPLTYRAEPLDGADDALVCTMEHTALGTRWVYDGCADPVFATMLAAATLTGVGQAAQVVEVDGRVLTWSPSLRIGGGGWTTSTERIDVGGLRATTAGDWTVLSSARLEVRLARRPLPTPAPTTSHLTGSWPGQDDPVLLATADVL